MPSPFKFDSIWLKYVEIREFIKSAWDPYDAFIPTFASIQFNNNLKKTKDLVVPWIFDKRIAQSVDLTSIESFLEDFHENDLGGYSNKDQKKKDVNGGRGFYLVEEMCHLGTKGC